MVQKKQKQDTQLAITYEDPDSINLWEGNPRRNDHSIEKLAKLFCIYGQRSPINVWEKDRVVYKGNTTLKTIRFLKNMSFSEYREFTRPIIEQGITVQPKPRKVAVCFQQFADLEEAKNYGKADNKSGEWSEWDEDMLEDDFDIKDQDPTLLALVTGFTVDEIKHISLIPDIDKINGVQTNNTGLSGIVKIICKPEEREDVIEWLKEVIEEHEKKLEVR